MASGVVLGGEESVLRVFGEFHSPSWFVGCDSCHFLAKNKTLIGYGWYKLSPFVLTGQNEALFAVSL